MAPGTHCYSRAHKEFACYWQRNRPSTLRLRCLRVWDFTSKLLVWLLQRWRAEIKLGTKPKLLRISQLFRSHAGLISPRCSKEHTRAVLQPPKFSRTWLKLTFSSFFSSESYF